MRDIEVWSLGGSLDAWRMEIWKSGDLEARCRRKDMGSGGSLQVWRHWRSGDLEARCRRGGMEIWRDGDVEV